MKKFSRIIACVLAFVMIVGSAASVFAYQQAEANWYDESIKKLYAWGIIDYEDVVAATDEETKDFAIDRHVFALWIARILAHEFDEDIWYDAIGTAEGNDTDSFKTGYADVDASTEELYRRAIAYVSANGLFEGYGDGNFGPYRDNDADRYYEDGTKVGGKVELYQACKVVISLLTRWKDEFNTTYLDDVLKYDEYLGDGTLRSRGTAFLWKSLSLGIVDKNYMDNCTEYFWDAELTYGEAAYILVNMIENVKPASCKDGCTHTDADSDGIIDCYIEDCLEEKDRDWTYYGIVTGVTANAGETLDGTEEITVSILTGVNTFVDVTLTAEEFAKAAVLVDNKVSLAVNPNTGYATGTVVKVAFEGKILQIADAAVAKAGIVKAAKAEEATIVPTGNSVYSTYLVEKDGAMVLPERLECEIIADANGYIKAIKYAGVEYTVVTAYSTAEELAELEEELGKEVNEVILTIDDKQQAAGTVLAADYTLNLAEGEMCVVFGDINEDETFDYVELKETRLFADTFDGLYVGGTKGIVANGTYSFILYNATAKAWTVRPIQITESTETGLTIAIVNADSKFYTQTDVLYKDGEEYKAYETVAGYVTEVATSAKAGYVDVTIDGKIYTIPASETLVDTTGALKSINETFYYKVEGDVASTVVDLNCEANKAKSFYADLVAAYAAMDGDEAKLEQKHLTLVVGKDGNAVHAVVDSNDTAVEVFDAGYVTSVKVDANDNNLVTVVLNQVTANGVVKVGEYTINLALSTSYGKDGEAAVAVLINSLIEDVPADKFAALSQLIYAEIFTDGLGNYILASATDVTMNVTAAGTETVLSENKLVKSEITSKYDATLKLVKEDGTKYEFDTKLVTDGYTTITNYYEAIVANEYAYVFVTDHYELIPAKVSYTTWYETYEFDAEVNVAETYVTYNAEIGGLTEAVTADTLVTLTYDIKDENGAIVKAAGTQAKISEIVAYQWGAGYDMFFYDDANNKGLFKTAALGGSDATRYYIFTETNSDNTTSEVVKVLGDHHKTTTFKTLADGTYSVEKTADKATTKVEATLTYTDGKWYNGTTEVAVGTLTMAPNATLAGNKFTVNGTVVAADVTGYTVYFITPSADADAFEFCTEDVSALLEVEITVVSYVVNADAKTITIFGQH